MTFEHWRNFEHVRIKKSKKIKQNKTNKTKTKHVLNTRHHSCLPECQILIWKTAMVTCSKLMQNIAKVQKKSNVSYRPESRER